MDLHALYIDGSQSWFVDWMSKSTVNSPWSLKSHKPQVQNAADNCYKMTINPTEQYKVQTEFYLKVPPLSTKRNQNTYITKRKFTSKHTEWKSKKKTKLKLCSTRLANNGVYVCHDHSQSTRPSSIISSSPCNEIDSISDSISLIDNRILPNVGNPAFCNRRTLARLKNKLIRHQPQLAGFLNVLSIDRVINPHESRISLMSCDDRKYHYQPSNSSVDIALLDICHTVYHTLLFSRARQRYSPAFVECHISIRKTSIKPCNGNLDSESTPTEKNNHTADLMKALSPVSIHERYNRSVDHFTLQTVSLNDTLTGHDFPPPALTSECGIPLKLINNNYKFHCSHLLPSD